jgi:hypothetical protein
VTYGEAFSEFANMKASEDLLLEMMKPEHFQGKKNGA